MVDYALTERFDLFYQFFSFSFFDFQVFFGFFANSLLFVYLAIELSSRRFDERLCECLRNLLDRRFGAMLVFPDLFFSLTSND